MGANDQDGEIEEGQTGLAETAATSIPLPAPDEPAGEGEAAMDIHKPKPVHSFREFLNEIAVIITGVLIALGLEQAVESWHHAEQVAEARETLRSEIRYNLTSWQYTLENAACTRTNMETFIALVEKRDVPRVYAMATAPAWQTLGLSFRATGATAWETVNASGLMAHMPSKEKLDYASAYQAMELERSLRRDVSDMSLAMISNARVYDGSVEASRELLKQASAINLYFERRPATYLGAMDKIRTALNLVPGKTPANVPGAGSKCTPYQPA